MEKARNFNIRLTPISLLTSEKLVFKSCGSLTVATHSPNVINASVKATNVAKVR